MTIDYETYRIPLRELERSDDTAGQVRQSSLFDAEVASQSEYNYKSEISPDGNSDTKSVSNDVSAENLMTLADIDRRIEEFEDLFKMSSAEYWEKRPEEIVDTYWGMEWFLLLRAKSKLSAAK